MSRKPCAAWRSGTLGEFAIAYDEGKLIGLLEGTGGITEILPDLIATLNKGTGARVVFDADPARLIDRLVDAYRTWTTSSLLGSGASASRKVRSSG